MSLEGGLTELPVPPATTGTTGHATRVVIQDPEGLAGSDNWWNAFDLTGIAQTPVPADAELTVEYYDTTDGQWKVLSGPIAGPTITSSRVPSAIGDIAGGVRFVYDYVGPDAGFAPGTDFAPNFTVALRGDGRYRPGAPYAPTGSTFLANCAQTEASNPNPDVADAIASMSLRSTCPEIELIVPEPGGPGSDFIDKEFGTSSSGGVKSVIARSDDTIPSLLRWGTGGYSNLDRVEITDVADPASTPIAESVFDVFNLTRVQPITPATDPLMAFDQVSRVELYTGGGGGGGGWVRAQNDPCPQQCIGTFPGVTLTTAERGAAVGVRLTFVESPDRAAASVGNLDAPLVGSGVARSFANARPITLTWQVRDTRRSDGAAALGKVVYNQPPQEGVVRNTVNATAYPAGGGQLSANAQDDVVIVDVPITTNTNKNWLDGPLAIPSAGLPATSYPLSRIVVTTRNTTPARVDRMWITDPAPGSNATVFDTQSFNRFIRIDNPVGADPTQTFVDLYFADGSSVTFSRAEALALTAATLPSGRGAVIGYQARFEGRITSGAAGVIEAEVRLSPVHRVTGQPVTVADSPVTNTAQGVVSDVDPPGTCPPPGNGADEPRYACDEDSATLTLREPSFGVEVTKSFTPAEQKEPDNAPIVMNLTGQPSGSARAVTMTITDADAAFWNAFELVGLDPNFALKAPITRVRACYADGGTFVDVNGTVVVNGGGAEQCSSNGGRLDEVVTFMNQAPADVHQISFQFWDEGGLGWSNPANPLQKIPVLVQRRGQLRTGGPVPTTRSDQIAAPGQPAAGVFNNHISGEATSVNVAPGVSLDANHTAEAQYRYLHLQNMVSVAKTPSGDVRPGIVIPFTLNFANAGERPISDPVFSDVLPMDAVGAQLIFDPDRDPSVSPYTFTLSGPTPSPAEGLPLPTDPAALTIDEQADRIVFRAPPGTVLGVGQSYRITIALMLRPGITPDMDVVNEAVIAGAEPFDDCVTKRSGGPYWSCSDTATVSPLAIPALSTIKYVKADAPHGLAGIPEVLSTADRFVCDGTATPEGFYRSPCVPVTLPGATETWRFTVVNSGTLPMDQIVSIDNLPTPGDQGLIATVPRESAWQPTFVGGAVLVPMPTTPVGAVLTTFYSTSSVPCTADLNPLGTQCAPGAWLPLQGAGPADVRSLKFVIKMPAGDLLQPGEALNLQFQTRTTATVRAGTPYPIAYNSVSTGGSAINTTAVAVPATEGRRVGVSLPTASISLQKLISGPAANLAPRVFPVQLVCTLDGAPITGLPLLRLVPGAVPVVVDGIPIGAECTATEGHFGQTSSNIGTATVGTPGGPIGVVRVENVYEISDLTIRKNVDAAGRDAQGNPIKYGPFGFSVVCTFGGAEVWADGYDAATPMTAALSPDELWALAGLPVNSACTVTETDALGAASTSFVVSKDGTPAAPVVASAVDVTIANGTTIEVEATNTFGAGSLRLDKVIDGAAGPGFGGGPFMLLVDCELDTGAGAMPVWSNFVTLGGARPLSATVDNIAAGAVCTVTEIVNGGANSTVIAPASVTIGAGTTVGVTVTNTFNAGSITVAKVVDGAGAALWGAGPFEVTLACTNTLGEPVAILGGAARELNAANGYRTTYDPLLVGLRCSLTETVTGGATSTTITGADNAPLGVFQVAAGNVEATVTNTFALGALVVSKTVSGGNASAHSADEFEIAAACTWNGAPIAVPGGAVRALSTAAPVRYAELPVGAECTIVETKHGGANAVTMTPASPDDSSMAKLTIGADAAASVVVDNRFDPPLPVTGMSTTVLFGSGGVAVGLLIAGAVLLVVRRRRQVV